LFFVALSISYGEPELLTSANVLKTGAVSRDTEKEARLATLQGRLDTVKERE
jgi:hypothetical protein